MPSPGAPHEQALVITVPAVEPLVATIRGQHDPSAALGMPAHITINYPFLPEREVSPEVSAVLTALCAHTPSFTFRLTEVRRFPAVVYLAPDPPAMFEQLIGAVASRFPDSPPYGGRFLQMIPHLTVAQIDDRSALDQVAREFQDAVRAHLPIICRATEVTLLHNPPGLWETREVFALGKESSATGYAVSAGRRM
jgi:2'-5' RNA ligase